MPPIPSVTNSTTATATIDAAAAAATTTTTPTASSQQASVIEPRKLELSLNPIDGSLQTAPLSQVLLATTDGLYNDLYNMVQGELEVVIAPATEEEEATSSSKKRERMANLSFAQRRHELSWRLAANGRALQHVAALTAAAAASDLSEVVKTSTTALTHTRNNWIAADEAQDALFFFHAQLFPGRSPPHDIYGAADLLGGKWWDLPRDLLLSTDRYETSIESTLSRQEVDERWQLAVRDKLITGEVGWMRQQNQQQQSIPLWRVSLKGGIVKLTHGNPKRMEKENQQQLVYPIEALLTVLPSRQRLVWTLLSVHVHVQAKTGEFNYQLETSNRQRYDLHRIAATAMTREEIRAALLEKEQADDHDDDNKIDADGDMVMNGGEKDTKSPDSKTTLPPARPLNALFQIVHTFSLSWQLEVLSAQAQALRRGVWAAAAADTSSITVAPVHFFDDGSSNNDILGSVSISFWKVDDTYGPPSMGDLHIDTEDDELNHDRSKTNETNHSVLSKKKHSNSSGQLTLTFRAESNIGIRVSLSGAQSIQSISSERKVQLQATTCELLEAASNPFVLSASDALLAATKICAELKCQAVMKVLQPDHDHSLLPPWISLAMENGSIAVAAHISYYGVTNQEGKTRKTVLFRIICDARTGGFVVTFSRSMELLRRLASNDIQASEPMSLRIAALPQNRRRAAGANSTGRIVRDSFDSLTRSTNMLGQRAGVGEHWDDIDDKSSLLRRRSILTACNDVKSSLSKCCGIAALYGLSSIALAAATGLEAMPDLAGAIVDTVIDGNVLIEAPPISVLLDQEIAETINVATDGSSKKTSYIEQSLFSICCSIVDDGVVLIPHEINVNLESPASFPKRTSWSLLQFKDIASGLKGVEENGLVNRPEAVRNGNSLSAIMVNASEEAGRFAEILLETIDWDAGI